jgi:citrate lyase beta subunit
VVTLDPAAVEALLAQLERGEKALEGGAAARRPVHVVYGGAHLFRADTTRKLGVRAREAVDAHAPDVATFGAAFGLGHDVAGPVLDRVRAKLADEPVEDFRIDFEDGFGPRSDAEEDEAAVAAAREVAKALAAGSLPAFSGFRIKALDRSSRARALRTLDLFTTELVRTSGGALPNGFVVTLPKVSRSEEVAVLADALSLLESSLGIASGRLRIELMVESTGALFASDGSLALPALVREANGRCTALHFGAYDYCSSLGVAASDQSLSHPACVFARQLLRIAGTQTGVAVSDGATNVLPVPVHRGAALDDAQRAENTERVHAAWRLHFLHVRQAFREGFACGWDLHPAQLVARYAAVYAHFASSFASDAARLRGFVDAAGQATLKGTVFDDAASALGLLNTFSSALDCGAASAKEIEAATGLTVAEIRGRSFAGIVEARRPRG